MKRPFRLILLGMLFWVLIIAIAITIFFNIYSKINFIPQENIAINFNNNETSDFDYGYGKFAYLNHKIFINELVIIDSLGNCKYFAGIGDKFKIYKDKIIFIKNDKLWSKDIDTGTTVFLSDNTRDFIVYKDNVIYKTFDPYTYAADLCLCDLTGGNRKILYKDIDNYCINGDSLYVVTYDDNSRLISISLTDFSYKDIMPFNRGFVNSMMTCGDKLLIDCGRDIRLWNLSTGESENVGFAGMVNVTTFVCDDDNIYISNQKIDYAGSLTSNIESEENGLWRIDPETLDTEKISSDVFRNLYLAGNGQLFGTLDGVPYLIDTETKQIQKIID